jgi:hypothetical protein
LARSIFVSFLSSWRRIAACERVCDAICQMLPDRSGPPLLLKSGGGPTLAT